MNLFDELVAVVKALDRSGVDYAPDGMQMQRVSKVGSGQLMTVDFILVNANLEPAWQSRTRRDTDVVALSIISRDALIAMKLAAGRPQDQADVVKLTEQDR